MRFIKTFGCFVFLVMIISGISFAQSFQFRHLNIEDGLSQSAVLCIMQDSLGIMWFGTQEGLNRFDGYHFDIFRHNPDDTNSISHSWIWDVFEDRDRNIWIATWHGLTKYNPFTKRFSQFFPDTANPYSIKGSRPTSICQDKDGFLWIGTWGGGLNRYDPETGRFTCYQKNKKEKKHLPDNFIRKVFYDRRGRLWVGTWNGLALAEERKDGSLIFKCFVHEDNDPLSIGSNQITSIMEDHAGNLWIGTLGGGLNLFSETDSIFYHYYHNKGDPGSISSNDISVMVEDHRHHLWIGTPTSGLDFFDREKGTFISIKEDPDDPGSLRGNNVYSICEDNSGLIWIGAGGLNIFDPRMENFRVFKHNSINKNSLNNDKVTCFYESSPGDIWIGTEGGGLNHYNKTSGHFSVYRHNPLEQGTLSSNNVSAIAGNGSGNIWIGTRGGGLNLFNPVSRKFVHITKIPANPDNEGLRYINALCFTSKNILWIATYNKGLIRYDLKTNTALCFKSRGSDKHALSGNYILRLYAGSGGKLWIGTWGAGLCCLDTKTEHFTTYLYDEKNSLSIAGNIVHAIYETGDSSERVIWAGTSSGLSYMNLNDSSIGKFRHLTINDGLPSNVIYGILGDDQGNIWLSTNKGMSRFNPKTNQIKNYDVYDGLQSNEFNGGAYLKLGDGSLLFGGVEGFNWFFPDKIKESTYQPPVVLTSFRVFNKEIAFNKSLNEISEIILSYKQNFFSFEFSALDFSQPAKIQYAYQMTGVDKNWVQAGKRRFASYTDMSPGNYVFQVKGTNSDGIWSDKIKTIKIIIKPPYWRTWWFKTLGILLILLIFYALHRYRVQKLLEIERLRIRIASDLHDDIGSALTRIAIHSEQIQTIRDKEKVISSSKKIGTISREIIATMSDIIWSIDARNDTIKDLADRMRDITYNTLTTEEIKVSFSSIGMDKNKRMPISYRQNLFYIYKEVINNILKHSGASEVNIRLSNSEKLFTMEISDNGHGFDPKKIRKGNGLKNIRMRAARIGAKLKIDSDNGVTIILKMKSF